MKNNVKKYRIWKGITQLELTKHVNISIGVLRRIENDPSYCPKYQVIKKLCEFFGVNVNQLF